MLRLTQKEMKKFYDSGKEMVWSYKTLYQIFYSQAQQVFYMTELTKINKPVTLRGQFQVCKVYRD